MFLLTLSFTGHTDLGPSQMSTKRHDPATIQFAITPADRFPFTGAMDKPSLLSLPQGNQPTSTQSSLHRGLWPLELPYFFPPLALP